MTCGTRFGCSFGRATDWQRVVQWLHGLWLKHVDLRRPRPPLSWAVRGSWNLVAIFAQNHCQDWTLQCTNLTPAALRPHTLIDTTRLTRESPQKAHTDV